MNAVAAYDKNGNAVSLRESLQVFLAVLAGRSAGFPGSGSKTFRSIDGSTVVVSGSSDSEGNRETDPDLNFTPPA